MESDAVLLSLSRIFSGEAWVRAAKKSNCAGEMTLNGVALDPKVLNRIGAALKALYDALIEAPPPQKIFDLLVQLEKEEQRE